MGTVEEYSNYPLTTTRTIAWDSPSDWGPGFSTESTFQPLTASNLLAHVKAQPSCFASKTDLLEQYYSSMKTNYNTDTLRLSPNTTDEFNHKKSHRRMTSTSSATTTKNAAIDVHPLPFPYHNDNIFLPTVETGRTRYDSESTQSLYDQQLIGPAHTYFLYSRQSNDTLSRINGGYHRYRRESKASYYSTNTTDTTASTTTTINTNNTQQNGSRLHRLQTTKRQLSKLICKNRFNTNSTTQRSLPTLLTRKRTSPSVFSDCSRGGTSSTPMTRNRSDSIQTRNNWNSAQHELRYHPSSSALISPAAYYDYCQGKPITSTPPSPSPSPQNSRQKRHAPEETPCGTTTGTTTSDVFATISLHNNNNNNYVSSPSQNRSNSMPFFYVSSRQNNTFISRLARKFWPFK